MTPWSPVGNTEPDDPTVASFGNTGPDDPMVPSFGNTGPDYPTVPSFGNTGLMTVVDTEQRLSFAHVFNSSQRIIFFSPISHLVSCPLWSAIRGPTETEKEKSLKQEASEV